MVRNNGVARNILKTSSQIRSTKIKNLGTSSLKSPSLPKESSLPETINYIVDKYQEKKPFFIGHLQFVQSQFERWQSNLPFVLPHYAVKSNPDRRLVQTLSSLGANFDCASMKEIQDVLSIAKNPNRIIFAHPFKIPSHLEYAASVGVNRMTADNISELEKIHLYHKNAKVQIRMKPDDSSSICKFSAKFGATIEEAFAMLDYAKQFNVDIVGTSFHVGSGAQSSSVFSTVLKDCSVVFSKGIEMGFNMNTINIGGGFPGANVSFGDTFETMAETIRNSIQENFGHINNLQMMGEPGRYFSSGFYTLVTHVIGKKEYSENGVKGFKYYLDEGIYGAFNCLIFDHAELNFEILKPRTDNRLYQSVVWGPTCDSIDKLGEFQLPEVFVGDVLYNTNFGSYTSASSTEFNGFKNTSRYYVS